MRCFSQQSAIVGCGLAFSMVSLICQSAGAATPAPIEIQGVLPVAADQPQIQAILENTATNAVVYGTGAYAGAYDIQGYLDTGTSGVLLSQETAQGFSLAMASYNSTPVTFNDIAFGGTDTYSVSQPYNVLTSPFSVGNDINLGGSPPPVTDFSNPVNNVGMEINQSPANPIQGPIDIFGMPVMQGNVTVFGLLPANNITNVNNPGETQTWIYKPGTAYNPNALTTNPGIVPTQYQVKLSFASFSQFTQVNPSGATAPMQLANPFIGPNPLNALSSTPPVDNTPPVTIAYTEPTTTGNVTRTSTGSFLFDTGAQASFISTTEAASLGISVVTDSSGNQTLVYTDTGKAVPNQFSLPVSGAGGVSVNAVGFYLSSLALQTTSGQTIKYVGAPVLVQNITLTDPATGQTLTLNGDLGMNFFEPSMTGDLSQLVSGPYSWMTFDQPNGLLGLSLASSVPEPSAFLFLLGGSGALVILSRRRHRSQAAA